MRKLLLLFILLMYFQSIYSQTFTNYTTANGLLGNDINAITVDFENNIWFGGSSYGGNIGGVSKFDGTNWITFTTDDGLQSCFEGYLFLNSLKTDLEGNVWAGTVGALSKKINNGWLNYRRQDGLISDSLSAIGFDLKGNIWVGFEGGGISMFNETIWTNYTSNEIAQLVSGRITAITVDHEGDLWVSAGDSWSETNGGISKFDGENWTKYTTEDGLISNKVSSIAIDLEGNKWIGTGNGVSKFDGTIWTSYTVNDGLINNSVLSIAIDAEGSKWFGTANGVSKLNGTTWTYYTTTNGLINNYIQAIDIDNEGNIWFGTNEGVSKLTLSPSVYTTIDIVLCEHELPFVWNSFSISEAGAYTETLTCISGCDSVVTCNVVIHSAVYVSLDTTICEGSPTYAWLTHSIQSDRDSTYLTILSNINGCDSIIGYNVTIHPAVYVSLDTNICEGTPTYDWLTHRIQSDRDSTYLTILSNINGCDSIIGYNVTISPTIYDTELQSICENAPAFIWNNHTILTTVDSIYVRTLESAAGCDSIVTLILNVLPEYRDSIITNICETDLPYCWESLTLPNAGTFSDTLISTSGCDSILTLNLHVVPAILTEFTEIACESFTWTSGDGNTYTTSGIYDYITTSWNGCEETLRLHLIITPDIILDATPTPVLCYGGNDGSIDLTVSGGIAPFTYLWENGEIVEDLTDLVAGSYKVVVTDSIGCTDSISVEITQPDELRITVVGIVEDIGVLSVGAIYIDIDGGTQPYIFLWSNGDTSKDISNQLAGTYTITVTDANGCETTYNIVIPAKASVFAINCPPMIIVGCTDEIAVHPPATYADYQNAGGAANSDCGIVDSTFAFVSEQTLDSTFCVTIKRIYSIEDSCGNSITCIQLLVVEDIEAPVVICPPADTVMNTSAPAPFVIYAEFVLAGYFVTDNCEIIETTFRWVSDSSDGNINPETITRTYEIADSCGNIGFCTQSIIVYTTSDVYLSIANLSLICLEDVPGAHQSHDAFIAAGGQTHSNPPYSIDPATFKWEGDATDLNICPETITRTYSIENTNGDYASWEQTIVVNDVEDPTFRLRTRNVSCLIPIPSPYKKVSDIGNLGSVDDNCGVDKLSIAMLSEKYSGSCPETLTRVYKVTDLCGNYRDATETWIIHDDDPPQILSGIPDIADGDCVKPDPLENYVHYQYAGGQVFDFCGDVRMSHIIDTLADPANLDVWHRVYRFFDDCDNYVDYVQKIIVNDTVNSVKINCPPSLYVECLPHAFMSADEFINAGGTYHSSMEADSIFLISENMIDINCPTRVERVYQIKNTNGTLSNYCTHEIIINDITDPKLNCPPNITVIGNNNIPNRLNSMVDFVNTGGSFSDNCSIDTSTFGLISEFMDTTLFPDVLKRTYYVADKCTNEDICLQQITIENATSVKDDLITENVDFKVYPNPNNGIFSIEVSGIIGDSFIEILDNNGRLIKRLELQLNYGLQTKEIDISDKVSGIYYIRLVNGEKEISKPIILK